MKRYPCSLDKFATYTPWFIIGLTIYIVTARLRSHHSIDTGIVPLPVIIVAILLPTLVIAMYLLKTIAVIVDENAITIERKIRPVVINFSDIRSVKRVENMRYTIRTFGNGGVFGYTGLYYKKGIGSMRWYCTQRKNYILIEKTNNKKIVITPDDPDSLMKDIEAGNPLLVAEIFSAS
ncbi:MAG: PH domain-containing protein [Chitinophagales bacterium]